MKNKNKTILNLFLLLFILFISISFVSAYDSNSNDLNNNDLSLSNENINYVDNDNILIDLSCDDGFDLNNLDSDSRSSNSNCKLGSSDCKSGSSNCNCQCKSLNLNSSPKSTDLDETINKSNNQLNSNSLNADESIIEVEHTGKDLIDIQNAISKAKSGDTVSLGNYSYSIGDGQINLTKSVNLIGDGNTLINGTGGVKVGCVIAVSSVNGATIKGIKFNNPDANLTYTDFDTLYGWTIRLDSSNFIHIDNCSFINYNREVNIDGSNNNTISNSYFTGASTRITNGNGKERGTRCISFSSDSRYNTIENNTFEGPVLDAINVDAAKGTKIIGNTFINNTYSIFLDHAASENASISKNRFIDCGHFETAFEGKSISFQDLPIINCAGSFSNFEITDNDFEVNDGNVLIYDGGTSGIGNVNISNNHVKALNDNDVSDIVFAQFPTVESKFDLIGHIKMVNNVLDFENASDMVYGLFGTSVKYYKDGDIIIYAPRKNVSLDISFADKVYANSVIINITLNGDSYADSVPLNGSSVILELNNKTYNITVYDGFKSFKVEDSLEISNYTVKASYMGNDDYYPASLEKIISIFDYSNRVFVNHTGNDTKDIIDAIDKASLVDIVDLGAYNYSNVETIDLNKDLIIDGTNSIIELSNSSDSLFNLGDSIRNLSISNVLFKVNRNNQSLISASEDSNLELVELNNIKVEDSSSDSLNDSDSSYSGSNSSSTLDYKTISLVHIKSNATSFSIEKFNLNNNSLLNGMKSIFIRSSNDMINNTVSRTKTKIISSDMLTTAVYAGDGRIGKYFIVSLRDENNNALANKEIKIGFNGKVYNKTTDENGSARLQINLAHQGIYTFAIGFIGDEDYIGSFEVSKITVKAQSPKMTVPNKSFKASQKTKTLNAVFKTAKGSFIKGKTIKFTVNGKTYSAKTNDNGQVSVKVSLSKKGIYAFTVKFAGDTTFKAITKKASLTIN